MQANPLKGQPLEAFLEEVHTNAKTYQLKEVLNRFYGGNKLLENSLQAYLRGHMTEVRNGIPEYFNPRMVLRQG